MRMLEISQQGFYCSQILIMLGLEKQGKENPDLVRAMAGLAGGLGFTGHNCGSLTGGACLLALYAGRGSAAETQDATLNLMIDELVTWFRQKYTDTYGGMDCQHIINGDSRLMMQRCPQIVQATYTQVNQILTDHGYHIEGRGDD